MDDETNAGDRFHAAMAVEDERERAFAIVCAAPDWLRQLADIVAEALATLRERREP
jgi:hypothetical protein